MPESKNYVALTVDRLRGCISRPWLVLGFAMLAVVPQCPAARFTPQSSETPAKDSAVRPSIQPGAYKIPGGTIYAGVEAEPANQPTIQFYDTTTRRTGTLENIAAGEYRTVAAPALTFVLHAPFCAVQEHKFAITDGEQRMGASLWHVADAKSRPTILLIHGADDETRDMGFLIPYFVCHGLNVVTYDQRGTGESTGNWQYTGPESKAEDAVAILKKIAGDPAVDAHKIGVWGFSNGGWVAPIVATRFPVAFMILKSASSETIAQNVLYEIGQDLREHKQFTPAQISTALAFEKTMLAALETNSNWDAAAIAMNAAKDQPWFPAMRIPPGMTTPPPPAMLAALQAALVYDPTTTLHHVHTPTLALFGALDQNVDAADSAARFRKDFSQAGLKDFIVITLPGAGHPLVASATGYEDDPSPPQRTVKGYPEAVISWLGKRGFAQNGISK